MIKPDFFLCKKRWFYPFDKDIPAIFGCIATVSKKLFVVLLHKFCKQTWMPVLRRSIMLIAIGH